MIGVFDSGVGGLTAVRELRRISPSVDICFLADRENSPYGTKSRRELTGLVKDNISRLASMGADRILMACCTASTVYSLLPPRMRKISCPIIAPAAMAAARATKCGRVGVIATDATVASRRFTRELLRHGSVKEVFELSAQPLVTLVEGGITDLRMTAMAKNEISELLAPIKSLEIDTLILGCTHFPYLSETVSAMLPGVRLVSPSRAGACEIMKNTPDFGEGKTIYI